MKLNLKKTNKFYLFYILVIFGLTGILKCYSQEIEYNFSPEGKLEDIYNNKGQKLKLKDILIDTPKELGVTKAVNLPCSSTSYFNLFFESGCGMEDTTNVLHNQRRAVLCKVFEDVSNFINSPLSTTGNRVNIWVRNIANENPPSGTLGIASPYYNSSTNNTNTIGGVLDGEVWKTIHLGVDSYTNVTNSTNSFYHGTVAFNFNSAINWNTNLSVNATINQYDLYTVILHEVYHLLGFNSFINQNGNSLTGSPYFSRYDTFLRTNSNQPLLNTGVCSMYNLNFNSVVSPTVLRPGCTISGNINSGVLNTTVCNNAIRYVGTSNVPVYTPTCFETGSSLSHFEDMLFPSCASPFGNDSYFLMSNAMPLGITKRFPKIEERNVLCDIGYNVKTTFGTTNISNGFFNYGGTACTGINVAGLNDGVTNGLYNYIVNINTSVSISGATILSNDFNATGFECLQDITAASTLSVTSGNSLANITFSSAISGLHVLRYIPINGNLRGNITYLYIFVRSQPFTGGCNPIPTVCDLVLNGDFEQFTGITTFTNIRKACGWDSVSQLLNGTDNAEYYSSTAYPTNHLYYKVPCNGFGFENSKNNVGNSYARIRISTGVFGKQHLNTRLSSPLQPNTNYQLSFDVSLTEGFSHWASNLQACLHRSNATIPTILPVNPNGDVGIVNNAMDSTILLIAPTITRNTNGWDTITFNFTTTTGGEQFLYLGLLKNATLVANPPAALGIGGCNIYQSQGLNAFGNRLISYYIDNVSLIPTNGAVFNLPPSICTTQSLNNLSLYLSGVSTNGVFSGNGVILTNGEYSFNPSVIGVVTIGYTYTNNNGCTTTLYDTINVSNTASNSIPVDAVNDDFSSIPIDSTTGGVTLSVYSNDIYNSLISSSTSLPNVNFSIVSILPSVLGFLINSNGLIFIPAGTPAGTYTVMYRLSVVGNCNSTDTATITIIVTDSTLTPPLVSGIRANNVVMNIELQSNNKSIISGNFTMYNNISRPILARLNTNLTLDQTFTSTGHFPNASSVIPLDIKVQSDDKIIIVGHISGWSGGSNGWGVARLLQNGSIDNSFNIGGAGFSERPTYTTKLPFTIEIQNNGKIIIGGDFYYYNGAIRQGIVRLNSNGSIDDTFNPIHLNNYFRSRVHEITIQNDGKLLLLGIFQSKTSGDTVQNLIRLNSDGSLDTSFIRGYTFNSFLNFELRSNLYSPIAKAVVQPDGKIIIAGAFKIYNGTNVNSIVRLNSDGSIDNTFSTSIGVDRAINELILEQGTNKPIIGGEFTTFGTTPIKKLVRLTNTGNLDSIFNIGSGTTDSIINQSIPYYSNFILALKQQMDGKIIVGGKFLTFNGLSATNITRIFGSAGLQARGNYIEFHSEPEIDTNPNNKNTILIYPNPSSGVFTINFNEEIESASITVFNVLGKIVYNQLLDSETQNQIDLSYLSNGYYIADISNKGITTQHKLIKN